MISRLNELDSSISQMPLREICLVYQIGDLDDGADDDDDLNQQDTILIASMDARCLTGSEGRIPRPRNLPRIHMLFASKQDRVYLKLCVQNFSV